MMLCQFARTCGERPGDVERRSGCGREPVLARASAGQAEQAQGAEEGIVMAGDVVLADPATERADVVEALLGQLGMAVVRCTSVEGCLEAMARPGAHVAFLLGHAELEDGTLLPALEQWYCECMRPLPQLVLWSPIGFLDVWEHARFLDRVNGLVLPLPLDVDIAVRLVQVLGEHPDRLRPPSPALACPAAARGWSARQGRRCCTRGR
jgi:hypothetical protein